MFILKMGAESIVLYDKLQRRLNKCVLVLFVILCLQTNVISAYSQVRRSGSAVVEKKHIENVIPMLKPKSVESLDDIKNNATNHGNNSKVEEHNSGIIAQYKTGGDLVLDEIAEAIDLIGEDVLPKTKKAEKLSKLEKELLGYVDETLQKDRYEIFGGVSIEPVTYAVKRDTNSKGNPRSLNSNSTESNHSFDTIVVDKFKNYAENHVLSVNVPQTARFFGFKLPQGKSSFLTGFGLGFLAFGLKKLLLPIFLGAQVVKSILIAMFLPSILGSLGKIVGKGLSQFSGSSINLQPQGQMEDVDYKDNMGYPSEEETPYTYPNGDTIGTLPANAMYGNSNEQQNIAMSRYGPGGARVTYLPNVSDNYYRNGIRKPEDFKVFKNIPASSLLLSNYDPFYSPLLSRLDSVFQRLGLGDRSEKCRERLVCLMYANPAKYAPYSNLVSAQLSRELNELRKPTSDNPEILRFFRYMKAAKEGQEGVDCARAHPQCPGVTADTGSAAMITTYNDINKLVSARKL